MVIHSPRYLLITYSIPGVLLVTKNINLHDPDNRDGVITHLEPDILQCEVKWALERISTSVSLLLSHIQGYRYQSRFDA